MKMNFVTVCSRPGNLPLVRSSLLGNMPDNWRVDWWVNCDENHVSPRDLNEYNFRAPYLLEPHLNFSSKYSPGCGLMRNEVFEQITNGYVHVLDDDNILHPNFWRLVEENIKPEKPCVLVGHQVFKNNMPRLTGAPENMRVCQVDSASIVWDRALQGDIMWNDTYECDGWFVEEMMRRHSDKFIYCNENISYYNYLR